MFQAMHGIRVAAVCVAAGLIWAAGSGASALSGGDQQWKAPSRDSRKKNPIPSDQGSKVTGQQVFSANCEPCHGVRGQGNGRVAGLLDPSPADLTSAKVAGQSDGTLYWKISQGHRPMPTFANNLPDEARWNVVNYVRTLAGPTTQPSGH